MAWDLVRDRDVEAVGIAGRNQGPLDKIRDWIKRDKLNLHILDVLDRGATEKLMSQYDLCINTLLNRRSSYRSLGGPGYKFGNQRPGGPGGVPQKTREPRD